MHHCIYIVYKIEIIFLKQLLLNMNSTIYNRLNNILHPHFRAVDDPYNDVTITNYEEIKGQRNLYWRLNGSRRLLNASKQQALLEMVKRLNLGEASIYRISGLGRYLILELY